MNDEAAFLQTIAAHPGDETHVLVFADWLDDHGDPRGQWIRNHRIRPWMGPQFASPVPALLESLAKKKRVLAVRWAVEIVGPAAVPGLVGLLAHADEYVRQQAAICLGKVGPGAKDAVPALLAALKDKDSRVRKAAASAVRDIGADAAAGTDALREALNDWNWDVRRQAARALGKMGAKQSVLDEIVERLADPDDKNRLEAVDALAQLQTAGAVAHLARALVEDPDPDVRKRAADYFRWNASAKLAGGVLGLLRAALSDRSFHVRVAVMAGLGRLGTTAREVVPDLIRNLDHGEYEVRSTAVYTLGQVGANDDTARDALIGLVGGKDRELANTAVLALGQWTRLPTSATPVLLPHLRRAGGGDLWWNNRSAVFAAFARLEQPSPEVLDELRAVLRSSDENAPTWQVAQALGAMGPLAAPAIPDLVALVARGEGNRRGEIEALFRIGGDAFPHLARLLESGAAGRREEILTALNWVRGDGLPLLPALLKLYRNTTDPYQRGQVRHAILNLGAGATDAIPALLEDAERTDNPDRWNIIAQLAQYGAALLSHLPRLLALARTDTHGGAAFARLAGTLAEHTTEVLEPLRVLIRKFPLTPADESDWNARWAKQSIRLEAARAFATLGPVASPAVPELLALLGDEKEDVRAAAVSALARIGPSAIAGLRQAVEDRADAIRLRVVAALGLSGDAAPETVAVLVRAVEDRAAKVRRAAIDALGRLGAGTPEVLATLRAAGNDPDPTTRTRAGVILRKLGPKPTKSKKKSP